jgi:hypothetical protein
LLKPPLQPDPPAMAEIKTTNLEETIDEEDSVFQLTLFQHSPFSIA